MMEIVWILLVVVIGLWIVTRFQRSHMTGFLERDTAKTLTAVRGLSLGDQLDIAHEVLFGIEGAVREIAGGKDKATVMRHYAAAAKDMRQDAIRRGASDYSNPDWAAAALLESWFLSNMMGNRTFQRIDEPVMAWAREVIERETGKPL